MLAIRESGTESGPNQACSEIINHKIKQLHRTQGVPDLVRTVQQVGLEIRSL